MSKKRGKVLTLGVIIGFFMGIFLAPKKGSELREDAKKKIDTIKENPKDVLHETFEEVKEKVSEIKDDLAQEKIEIEEEDIVVSRTFDEEGENK
ncbi:YtxH domain-containing protein [Intestinibacter sp.]|uniref:YtxH domain-containing protein n=1 Tax=Intestinibacter sp. TaxID=1965304 RepID=UPI002A75C69E|nr:YtxH domain-containing protein [Intestinibacter sp.]MDY2737614.1 YtxH domain-containing protein [Intestinibacter sp.]MDY4573950.1 YtxH domain-containing protein [Intestinibacter sp.]